MELLDKRVVYLYENLYNEKVTIVDEKIECTVQFLDEYLNLWMYIHKTKLEVK